MNILILQVSALQSVENCADNAMYCISGYKPDIYKPDALQQVYVKPNR